MSRDGQMYSLTWDVDHVARWTARAVPTVTAPGEALVRPIAVACCDLDIWTVTGSVRLRAPFAVGHEGVAEVVAVGEGVRSISLGDRVVVPFQISCGLCGCCRRGRTESCERVPPLAMYGMAPLAGLDGGGFLSDLVHVPFADAMLVPVPADVDPAAVASCSDNVVDAWRCVAPFRQELADLEPSERRVLIAGSGSVGLYAAAIAVGFGFDVTYVDDGPDRLRVADRIGAEVIESLEAIPRRTSYPVTVATGTDVEALRAMLAATWPGGICTDTGIHFEGDVTLPMLALYTRGVRLITGRASARADLPDLLDFVAGGHLHPEIVTHDVVPWSEAAEAWPAMQGKTVFVRD